MNYGVVGVIFQNSQGDYVQGSKVYYYKTLAPIHEGDLVVVDVSSSLKVVLVVEEVSPEDAAFSKATKWVVQRVDMTDYLKIVEKEKQAATLRRLMDQYIKQHQELAVYQQIANIDSNFAKLFEEYKELME